MRAKKKIWFWVYLIGTIISLIVTSGILYLLYLFFEWEHSKLIVGVIMSLFFVGVIFYCVFGVVIDFIKYCREK